ncbi:MAG: hypothetical protein GXP31_07045 [Kiritimatiellaeota bacterium]|nr:hypothetical protein [Kiritimatiellota bacterium]
MEQQPGDKTLIMQRPPAKRKRAVSIWSVGLGTVFLVVILVLTVLQPILSQRATLGSAEECTKALERLAEQASTTLSLFVQTCAKDLQQAAVARDSRDALRRLGQSVDAAGKPLYRALFLFAEKGPGAPAAAWPDGAEVPPTVLSAVRTCLRRAPGFRTLLVADDSIPPRAVLVATTAVGPETKRVVAVALVSIKALDRACGDLSAQWRAELQLLDERGRPVLGRRPRTGANAATATVRGLGWRITASAAPRFPRNILIMGLWSVSLATIVFLLLVVLLAARMVRNEARLSRLLTSANAHLRAYGGKLEQMVADQTVDLRRAKERAEEANRLKGEFLANMSHEIRTPLNAIVGFAELMAEMELPKDQEEYIRLIRESADTLLELVNNVLDFAKMDADGIVELTNSPFNPGAVIDDVWRLFRPVAEQKGIRFHADPGSLPTEILGDALRLKQALGNLVSNGIKFTPENGEVLVRGRTVRQTDTTVTLEISVTDTGIGIPAEFHEIIFEPFRQVDASSTREYGGTGLGLAITRRLVEGMGGSISVESRPGRGSRFSVTFTAPRVGPGTVPGTAGMV